MNDCGNVHVELEMMEMDWSHFPQAGQQHYTTSLDLEPREANEKRTTEKYVVQGSGSRCQRNGIQLETIGKVCSGLECLAESCWRSIPQKGQ